MVFDGVLKVVDSTGEIYRRRNEGVPFGLLRSHAFNWGARNQNKRYVNERAAEEQNLPVSRMAKKGADDTKLPMAWMSKKSANVENKNLPMAWMSKKSVQANDEKASDIPMRFMYSKKSTDVCKRAIEVCSRSLNKRTTEEEDILNELEGELKDKKIPL